MKNLQVYEFSRNGLCHFPPHHPGPGEGYTRAEDDLAKPDVRQTRTWAMPARGQQRGALKPAPVATRPQPDRQGPHPWTVLPCFFLYVFYMSTFYFNV